MSPNPDCDSVFAQAIPISFPKRLLLNLEGGSIGPNVDNEGNQSCIEIWFLSKGSSVPNITEGPWEIYTSMNL